MVTVSLKEDVSEYSIVEGSDYCIIRVSTKILTQACDTVQ